MGFPGRWTLVAGTRQVPVLTTGRDEHRHDWTRSRWKIPPGAPFAIYIAEAHRYFAHSHSFSFSRIALQHIASIIHSILFSYIGYREYPTLPAVGFLIRSVRSSCGIGSGCDCSENLQSYRAQAELNKEQINLRKLDFLLFGPSSTYWLSSGCPIHSTDRLICNFYLPFFTLITGIIIFRLLERPTGKKVVSTSLHLPRESSSSTSVGSDLRSILSVLSWPAFRAFDTWLRTGRPVDDQNRNEPCEYHVPTHELLSIWRLTSSLTARA